MAIILLVIPAISMFAIMAMVNYSFYFDRWLALVFSLINFIHLLQIKILFDQTGTTYQFQFQSEYLLSLAIDGVSLWLIWQVNLIMAVVIVIVSYQPYQQILLILVGFWSIAVFVVMDLLQFYISFEGVLIPMQFVIGWYGGGNGKIHAAYQLFIYTLFGSLFLLLALIMIFLETGTTDYQVLLTMAISINREQVLWLALFCSLAIKIPMIPFHLWLISAHVEAPTAGSVLLAAIHVTNT